MRVRPVEAKLVLVMITVVAVLVSGCGDGADNESNGNDNGGPVPIRTATPAPIRTATPASNVTPTGFAPSGTPTPGGALQQFVNIDFTTTEGVQGFQVQVSYPIEKGSFAGSGSAVACSITGGGAAFFTKNDKDDGDLVLSVAGAENLIFPVEIACQFDATSPITSSDIAVTVDEVTQNNASGDTRVLTATASVDGEPAPTPTPGTSPSVTTIDLTPTPTSIRTPVDPAGIERYIAAVRVSGVDASLVNDELPTEGDGAPRTIDDVQGPAVVHAGDTVPFDVAFDTGALSGTPELLVGIIAQGSPVRGFYVVPLAGPAGFLTLDVQIAASIDQSAATLSIATRLNGVVGRSFPRELTFE